MFTLVLIHLVTFNRNFSRVLKIHSLLDCFFLLDLRAESSKRGKMTVTLKKKHTFTQ